MLTIRDLSMTYANGVQALERVCLDVPVGMFGLLGPNGAGKSTLMRTVATLQGADQGTIHLDQLDVLHDRLTVRRILGYLPQDFGLYPKISAVAMLDHLAALKGISSIRERRTAVEAMLKTTNLWEVRKLKLGTFSGGMRQRFGVAQALLGRPKLIIVDEPTAGLDPEERRRFLNMLNQIAEQSTVILSTHIVDDVRDTCSQMAVIDHGRVLVTGKPDDLVSELEGTIWETTVSRQKAQDLESSMNVISTRLVSGRTVLRIKSTTLPSAGFTAARPDLEDVYFLALKEAPQAKGN